MAAEPRAFLPLRRSNDPTRAFEALRSARHVDVAAGEVLPCPRDRVLVLLRGALVVRALGADRAESVDVCGDGDIIGEGSLLARAWWRSVASRALVPTRALSVCSAELCSPGGLGPEVSRLLVLGLARTADRCSRRAGLLRTFAVRDRVLGILLDLAGRFGRSMDEGIAIPLPLTQDLIASLAGATRESVNRALSDLRARGEVRRTGGVYVVSSAPLAVRSNEIDPSPRSRLVTAPSTSSLSR